MPRTSDTLAPLTLRTAIDDLGWIWLLFATLVGAPSILALLQMVFVEHRLIDSLQWIVDGYNQIVVMLADRAEPFLLPIIAWANETFDWRLDLQPHWRPLFLLVMVRISANARLKFQPPISIYDAFFSLPVVALATLAGVVVAGSVPITGNWQAQAAIAATPVAAMSFAIAIMGATSEAAHQGRVSGRFINAIINAIFYTFMAWALGTGLAFVQGIDIGAGVIALGLFFLVQGVLSVVTGLATGSLYGTRLGLIMLGGFFTAGAILLADAIIKVLTT